MTTKGEDVRSMSWYKKCDANIIKQYIIIKERMMAGEEDASTKIEIIFSSRSQRMLKPLWFTTVKDGDKPIPVPLDE